MKILSKVGNQPNTPINEYIVDTVAELEEYTKVPFGSLAYVIATKKIYIFNGNKEWVEL